MQIVGQVIDRTTLEFDRPMQFLRTETPATRQRSRESTTKLACQPKLEASDKVRLR